MSVSEVSLPFYKFVLDFLAEGPSPLEIVQFRPSPAVQARFSELLQANGERELTLAEDEELEHYLQIDRIVSLLKAKAYRNLDANPA
jgi:hypothetical protein